MGLCSIDHINQQNLTKVTMNLIYLTIAKKQNQEIYLKTVSNNLAWSKKTIMPLKI
jgi:hypothetical protein